jgi:hypothetical protein
MQYVFGGENYELQETQDLAWARAIWFVLGHWNPRVTDCPGGQDRVISVSDNSRRIQLSEKGNHVFLSPSEVGSSSQRANNNRFRPLFLSQALSLRDNSVCPANGTQNWTSIQRKRFFLSSAFSNSVYFWGEEKGPIVSCSIFIFRFCWFFYFSTGPRSQMDNGDQPLQDVPLEELDVSMKWINGPPYSKITNFLPGIRYPRQASKCPKRSAFGIAWTPDN